MSTSPPRPPIANLIRPGDRCWAIDHQGEGRERTVVNVGTTAATLRDDDGNEITVPLAEVYIRADTGATGRRVVTVERPGCPGVVLPRIGAKARTGGDTVDIISGTPHSPVVRFPDGEIVGMDSWLDLMIPVAGIGDDLELIDFPID